MLVRADNHPTVCEGLRVVELAQGMSGPLTTMILGDYGAEVIKIEPPSGDWARRIPAFSFWNRQKKSVVLDIDLTTDADKLRNVIAASDVFVEDLSPAKAGQAGLVYESLKELNPRLIHCSITAFGRYEGLTDVPSSDALVAARTGRMIGADRLSGGHVPALRDGPIFTCPPVGSFGASQLALQAVLAALINRSDTGRGEHIETSLMMGASAFLMRQEMTQETIPPEEQIKRATVHRGIELCFLVAKCADGKHIQMCARQDHHFSNWMKALGMQALLEEPAYSKGPMAIPAIADVDALEELIRERMSERSRSEWMEIFTKEYDIGADPFFTPAEFLWHKQMTLNDKVATIYDSTYGTVRQLGALASCSNTPARISTGAPLLGQHNDEIVSVADTDKVWECYPVQGSVPARPKAHLLEGTTIVELAYFIAGPMATSVLAELGARIIKIEPPSGDPYRRTGIQAAKFLHGKESISLDLKAPEGIETARRLVAGAQGFIHNFRPGVMERLGMDYETLRGINKDIVYVNASSYGSKGPQKGRIAFHSTGNAICGSGIIQAGKGNTPVDDSYPDPASALGAATAMMLGLLAQRRGQGGQSMETMMLSTSGYVMSPHMVVKTVEEEPCTLDTLQQGYTSTFRIYRCIDGWLCIAARTNEEIEALGSTFSLGDVPRHEWSGVIEAELASSSTGHWEQVFSERGVPSSVVENRPFDEWLVDMGLVVPEENVLFGKYFRLAQKVFLAEHEPKCTSAPQVGEQSEEILHEIGYSTEVIEDWKKRGIVHVPEKYETLALAEAGPP
ncbi:MAG: CoA transferase [Acidimicrobiales bacterium]